MTTDALLGALSDGDVVGLTLFGEARGQTVEGRIAVANVIGNRVAAQVSAFGLTHRAVCLKPWQFSCWRPEGGQANYELLMDAAANLSQHRAVGPLLKECLWIADGLLREQFRDYTRGATHYLTSALYESHPPAWAKTVPILASLGAHVFLRAH